MNKINNKTCLILIILGIVVYTIVFTSLCSLRYQAFFSYEWEDEAAENQLLWNTAHGNFLRQTIFETKSGIFVNHFSPIYILLSFLYAIFPRIYTLYFLISLSFALGAIPIYLLAKKIWATDFQACLLAFTYLFYSPLHWVNVTTVEPVMFSTVFLLFTFYFFYEQRFRLFLVFLVLSLMTKENISLIAIMFGLYAMVKKKDLKWIIVPLLLGVAWFVIAVWVIYPKIGSTDGSPFHCLLFDFSKGGGIDLTSKHFWKIVGSVFSDVHLLFFTRIFQPILFLSFFSLEWLISLPIYLQICLLAEDPANAWSYSISPIIPFIFLGLIFSFGHIKSLIWKFIVVKKDIKSALMNCLVMGVMISSVYSNFGNNMIGFSYGGEIMDTRFLSADNIYDKRFYSRDADDETAWELINLIPKDASVSASGDLLVPLSHRSKLLEFAFDDRSDGGGQDYYDVDYILIHKKFMYHGGGHYAEIKKKHLDKVKELVNQNVLEIISEKRDFILLKSVK